MKNLTLHCKKKAVLRVKHANSVLKLSGVKLPVPNELERSSQIIPGPVPHVTPRGRESDLPATPKASEDIRRLQHPAKWRSRGWPPVADALLRRQPSISSSPHSSKSSSNAHSQFHLSQSPTHLLLYNSCFSLKSFVSCCAKSLQSQGSAKPLERLG